MLRKISSQCKNSIQSSILLGDEKWNPNDKSEKAAEDAETDLNGSHKVSQFVKQRPSVCQQILFLPSDCAFVFFKFSQLSSFTGSQSVADSFLISQSVDLSLIGQMRVLDALYLLTRTFSASDQTDGKRCHSEAGEDDHLHHSNRRQYAEHHRQSVFAFVAL